MSSAKKSLALSFYTLLSRVLGLVRDHFMATSFGTGMVASAFSVAYRLPNMFRNLLAEGTLSQSFMPIFSDYESRSIDEARIMTGSVLSFLFFLLSLFVGIFLFFAPLILPILVGGTKEYGDLVVDLSFILFFLIMTASLSSIFMAISNSQDRYFIPSLSPIILNFSYIIVFIVIFPLTDTIMEKVRYLSFGIVIGGLIQLVVQGAFVYMQGLGPSFNLNWSHPAIAKIFRLMLPAVVGGGFYQLGLLVDIFLANYIQNQNPGLGAVVSLDYSQRLVQLPTGIIGVALATTILPSLLKKVRNHERDQVPDEIGNSFRFALFLTVPASIGLLTMGTVVLDSIYFGGRWDHIATATTLVPLGFYALAIPFYSMNKILISSFYAFQDTKTPLKVQAISFGLSMVVAISLMNVLKHSSIALASALSSALTFCVLILSLRNHDIIISLGENLKKALRLIPPLILLAIWTCFISLYSYSFLLEEFTRHELSHANASRIILLIGIIPAMGLYFFGAYLTGVEEWKILFGKLRRKRN
ncbi:murein biosynthesis integral membrane protein MurJ [Leptospira sp. GIMC2001]|uniref:murein biosynthesis integral membrane protein MurJ n=1 Tax=Leptospira sp. GIMC2001 TaxID=1513297 RepID=UPI00234A4E33|nr:murein biosynthesis integral membrane protein MurJ [Leptospira sp. GIMC2001]WCL50535.1 murein biosynthesis integral membrane protein MurJ [Leptospira sp. GIMC2001]